MFGHQDEPNQHYDAGQPTPDGNLVNDNLAMPAPGIDVNNLTPADVPAPAPHPDTIEPSMTMQPAVVEPPSAPAMPAPAASGVDAEQLLDIKQQALQQLSPLVGHLDQDPEEKFRTTMMMIQAADNSSLLKSAYDAALQIPDEKVRAQALLDIVNEINYFTHNSAAQE